MAPVEVMLAMTFGVAQLMHKDEQGGYGLLLQLYAYVCSCSLGDRSPTTEGSGNKPHTPTPFPPPSATLGLVWFGEVADILSEAALHYTNNIISIFLQERREAAVQLSTDCATVSQSKHASEQSRHIVAHHPILCT